MGCKTVQPLVSNIEQETIYWSGIDWILKKGEEKQGPGPNFFSGDQRTVWVDELGFLHLTIRKVNGKWLCSEIVALDVLGYGNYSFQLASNLDQLDPNAVLGLFTWRSSGGKHNNEIDIEISRWGDPFNQNTQYVIQPYSIPGNIYRFNVDQNGEYCTHEFLWMPETIYFHSYHGHYSKTDDYPEIKSWIYTKSMIPNSSKTHVRINLWLNNPSGTRNRRDIEIVLKSFNFTPLKELK